MLHCSFETDLQAGKHPTICISRVLITSAKRITPPPLVWMASLFLTPYPWRNQGTSMAAWFPRCDRKNTSWHASGVVSACRLPNLTFQQCCFLKDCWFPLSLAFSVCWGFLWPWQLSWVAPRNPTQLLEGDCRALDASRGGSSTNEDGVDENNFLFFLKCYKRLHKQWISDLGTYPQELTRFPNIKRVLLWLNTGILPSAPDEHPLTRGRNPFAIKKVNLPINFGRQLILSYNRFC